MADGQPVQLFLKATGPGEKQGFVYPLAGSYLHSDTRLPNFATFFAATPPGVVQLSGRILIEPDTTYNERYVAAGLLSNVMGQVSMSVNSDVYYMEIAGVGEFVVTADGRRVQLLQAAGGIDKNKIRDHALGAPLILALACQGTWCFHASAVLVNDRAVAFAGESGAGKSTTARYLAENGFPRISDDVLATRLNDEGVPFIYPDFPQAGMEPGDERSAIFPDKVPLGGICLLKQCSSGKTSIERLTGEAAFSGVLSHTMGSRLFDRRLRKAHLDMGLATTVAVPVWQLTIPHRMSALVEVVEIIGSL